MSLTYWNDELPEFYQKVKTELTMFLSEHPDEVFNFFVVNILIFPDHESEKYPGEFGDFALSLDTYTNSLSQAKKWQKDLIERRKMLLQHTDVWKTAYHFMEQPGLKNHTAEAADFSFPNAGFVRVENWKRAGFSQLPANNLSQDNFFG
jgi:hypothetical protein